MKTETPRTDKVYPPEVIDREFKEQGRIYGWGTLHDMRECSRKLERENNALLEALELFIEPGDSEKLRIARAAIALVKEEQQ